MAAGSAALVAPESPKPVPADATLVATAPVAPASTQISNNPEQAAKTEAARVHAEKAQQEALAHFEFDSAALTATGRAMLDAWLLQASSDLAILVTGHADRLGPQPYNEKLSLLRAQAVKKYLSEKASPARRIQVLAKGEALPVVNCEGDATPETKACLAPNRRAEVTAKPKPIVKPIAKPAVKPAVKPVAKPIAKPEVKKIGIPSVMPAKGSIVD